MVEHFIRFKGKGMWVFSVPLICSIVLFMYCDISGTDSRYVRPACLLISAVILWFVDKGHHLILYSKNTSRDVNSIMWIDVKYWAIALAIAGFIALYYADKS